MDVAQAAPGGGLEAGDASRDSPPADSATTAIVDPVGEPFDEIAESAFRAEAKARGETPVAVAKAIEPEDTGPLPPLDDLVKRIPAEVRETLDDLFRAKFVTVKRVPAKALK